MPPPGKMNSGQRADGLGRVHVAQDLGLDETVGKPCVFDRSDSSGSRAAHPPQTSTRLRIADIGWPDQEGNRICFGLFCCYTSSRRRA